MPDGCRAKMEDILSIRQDVGHFKKIEGNEMGCFGLLKSPSIIDIDADKVKRIVVANSRVVKKGLNIIFKDGTNFLINFEEERF